MNRMQIIGRLTANPELRTTSSGISVCGFTVAVNRRFDKEEADFFPVTVWRDLAVNCNKYLAKGSQVAVCGSLQIRKYEDSEGIKRIAVDLQADEVEFLSSKSDGQTSLAKGKQISNINPNDLEQIEDEDMPF